MGKGRGVILFGAGAWGDWALDLLGPEKVHCFVDNRKAGEWRHGKPVLGFDEFLSMRNGYDVIISASGERAQSIAKQLHGEGVDNFRFFEDVRYLLCPINRELTRYKDAHRGKECFIIGNGPSLLVDDLNGIAKKRYISFASNRIDKIFDKTIWRPDLYCSIDSKILKHHWRTIINLNLGTMLIHDWRRWMPDRSLEVFFTRENISYFNVFYKPFTEEECPDFSSDPSKYVVEGMTVTYVMLQWAAYMGFSAVYLLGVDLYFPDPTGKHPANPNHFCPDYVDVEQPVNPPRVDLCRRSYEKAECYSRKHGFRIYNATRGGKLDVFERVNIDTLLKNDKNRMTGA